MKKYIIIALSLLMVVACKKSSNNSATSGSTFNITFNGKTFHESSGSLTGLTTSNTGNSYLCDIEADTKNIQVKLFGIKYSSSTATGTYHEYDYNVGDFSDVSDGGKNYEIDTTSTITITQSDAGWVKGTFSLTLHYNGSTYPATGDFAMKH